MSFSEVRASEGAILSRVIQPDKDELPSTVATALLKLGFPQEDRERMHNLASRNQEGQLTAQEAQELANYRRVGRLLDLLAAKARLALKKNGKQSNRH